MWLTDLFKRSYVLPVQQTCLGCVARIAHIEDLQNLLRSEREGNAILQTALFQRAGLVTETVQREPGESKPLRTFQTTAQLRRAAEARESKEAPNAKQEYWAKVQADYDKAGKLPIKEEVVEVDG